MYTTINQTDFINAFRAIRPDNFSYEGLCALFEYFMQYEEDTGEQVELDVIAICCHWTESGYEEVEDMFPEIEPYGGIEEFLSDHTTLIELSNGKLLFQNF